MFRDLSFRDVIEFFEELLNPLHRDDPRRVTLDHVKESTSAGHGIVRRLARPMIRLLLRRRCARAAASLERRRPDLSGDLLQEVRTIEAMLGRAAELLEVAAEDDEENARAVHEASSLLHDVGCSLSRLDDVVLSRRLSAST